MKPVCPKCQELISNADVNVSSDVALCRRCNTAHKFSELVHGLTLHDVEMTRPPDGVWRRQEGMSAVIGATHRSVGMAIGTLFFALFWNGIVSVFVLLAISSTLALFGATTPEWFPNPKMNGEMMTAGITIFLWLFLTPFILIGLAMIAAFFSALGGRTEIRIGQTEGIIFSGIGSIGRRKRFSTEMVKDVRIENKKWRDRGGDRRTSKNIIIEMQDGKLHKLGSTLREDRMKFVAAVLQHALVRK